MMRFAVKALPLLVGASAWSHDGHGAARGAHLHAFDIVGLVAAAVFIGAWLWRRGDR